MDRFYLKDSHKVSPTWHEIQVHLNERLAHYRKKNDGDLTEQQTQRLRGQIAEVKAFIAFAEDPPRVNDN